MTNEPPNNLAHFGYVAVLLKPSHSLEQQHCVLLGQAPVLIFTNDQLFNGGVLHERYLCGFPESASLVVVSPKVKETL